MHRDLRANGTGAVRLSNEGRQKKRVREVREVRGNEKFGVLRTESRSASERARTRLRNYNLGAAGVVVEKLGNIKNVAANL